MKHISNDSSKLNINLECDTCYKRFTNRASY